MKKIRRLFYYIQKLGVMRALRRTLIFRADTNKVLGFCCRIVDFFCVNKYKKVKNYRLNEQERDCRIVVSLTTIPDRIEYAALVIGILLNQTVRPDKIQLYLGKKEFENVELPRLLVQQQEMGVDILYVEDLRPHTKYFYTMQKFPEDIVITVDDDVLYEENLIEKLLESYQKFPDAISAMRVHQIVFRKNKEIAAYNEWKYCSSEYVCEPRLELLATGVGGVLYPPHCMPEETFRRDIFEKYCPLADDIWLKVVQIMAGVPCVLAKEYMEIQYLTGSQDSGLFHENVVNDKNDVQLEALLHYYNEQRYIDIAGRLLKQLSKGAR